MWKSTLHDFKLRRYTNEHFTSACFYRIHLSPVYMIQPVVKPVVKPVWQPGKCLYTRYNRLSNPLSIGCQTRLTTVLTTGWMFVYTIQPVVKPVVQPVWQPVVSCKRGFRPTIRQHQARYDEIIFLINTHTGVNLSTIAPPRQKKPNAVLGCVQGGGATLRGQMHA